MNLLRQFVFVEVAALFALLITAAAMAGYGAADSALHSNSLLSPSGSARLGFSYTVIIGVLPVIFIGALGYLILLGRGLARWPYVLLLGIAPGLLALVVSVSLGVLAIICGLVVAALTHLMCRRLGPNNSFKPKPLRGSA